MDLQVTLGLLLAVSAVIAQPVILPYTPEIANLTGNVTNRAFVLVQPNCTFAPYRTDNVWLVVALNTSFSSLTDTELDTPAPYSLFINGMTPYYHTLYLAAEQFPCLNQSTNSLYLLQIGSETNCIGKSFCNGPLNTNHTYRTKFILVNGTGGLVAETMWSSEIVLKTATENTDIAVPFSRSGGMIVITVLLSVLLAILLICLIVALAIGSKNICWRGKMDRNEVRTDDVDYMTSGRYTSLYQKIIKSSTYEQV